MGEVQENAQCSIEINTKSIIVGYKLFRVRKQSSRRYHTKRSVKINLFNSKYFINKNKVTGFYFLKNDLHSERPYLILNPTDRSETSDIINVLQTPFVLIRQIRPINLKIRILLMAFRHTFSWFDKFEITISLLNSKSKSISGE